MRRAAVLAVVGVLAACGHARPAERRAAPTLPPAPVAQTLPVPETLATAAGLPLRLALDETHVYWADDGGRIARVPKGGGPVQVIVEHAVGQGRVADLALGPKDDLHWADTAGDRVM